MPRIWAIADLHLSFANPKPMDVFGSHWSGHAERIKMACEKLIEPGDLLLIPGDVSWAMKRAEAITDLAFIAALPGEKVLIKGNHDYWWDSDTPLNYPGLHGNQYATTGREVGVAGTRGWPPLYGELSDEERQSGAKIIAKEVRRLEKRLKTVSDCKQKIVMIHHPPIAEFLPVLQQYGVEMLLYGHVHLGGSDEVLPELWNEMRCYCVAADRIGFIPKLVGSFEEV